MSDDSIAQANTLLQERLDQYRFSDDPDTRWRASSEINDVLYEAILRYPTEVNAVVISLAVSPRREDTGMPDAPHHPSGRETLNIFLESLLATKTLPEMVDLTLVKHLPYAFTTGTHGSGERVAVSSSCPTVSVDGYFDNTRPDFLEVSLRDTGISHGSVYFFPDEINSVKLQQVKDQEYTPEVRNLGMMAFQMRPVQSSVLYYLRFRGMRELLWRPTDIRDERLRERLLAKDGKLLIPSGIKNLFHIKDELFGSYFSGFAADVSGQGPILYGFDRVPVPRNGAYALSSDLQVAYALDQHARRPRRGITTYTGNSIIEQLAQIEPKRDF